MADLTFYSSVRRGAALAITREDFSQAPTNPDDLAHARVKVALDYGNQGTQPHVANTILPLVGPGDIVGLDGRCVVRSFPRPDDNDAEVEFLCYVDFDQVDLPWRYTPTHYTLDDLTGKNDRVRPWLTLLVLAEGSEVTDDDVRAPTGTEKLPQLTVRDGNLLPDLKDAWAWAHVQGQQTQADAEIAATLNGRPGALIGRLMSPRALAKTTAYRAFLVPTFMRGVFAGQGKDPQSDEVKNTDVITQAWEFQPTTSTVLPVYYSWRFQTGSVASFREVARQLRPAGTLPDTLGQRDIDVATPGFLLASPTGPTHPPMKMGGALQTTVQAGQGDPSVDGGWVNGLSDFIASGILNTQDQPRVVAPPLYGRWYAAEDHLDKVTLPPPAPPPPAPTNPPWFSALNEDPRHRVAAGLGTEVVQRDQQALMAAALDQTSRIVDNVNRVRKVMQAGREVFTRLVTRHLDAGAAYSTLLITSFLHGKILNCTGATPRPTIGGIWKGSPFGGIPHPWRRRFPFDPTPVIDKINNGDYNPNPGTPPGTPTPDTTLGGTVPGGLPDPGVGTIISTMSADQRLYWGVLIFWVARRLLSTEAGKYWWLLRRLLRLGLDLIQLAATQGVQGVQAVTVLEKLRAGTLSSGDIAALPIVSNFVLVQRDPVLGNPASWPTPRAPSTGGTNPPDLVLFKQAAGALFDYVNGTPVLGPVQTKVNVPNLVNCILTSLSPTLTFAAAEKARHQLIGNITWNAADKLEPILVTPQIQFPVWSLLRDVSPEWILPGVGDLPRNSVSLVTTNQKFIEAFMVGLNHEMNRELLWNGYPTDQRGTFFQQFWDFRGWVAKDVSDQRTDDKFADITEVKGWNPATGLGAHSGRPSSVNLVLLVRGDVIKRYPNVVVYASPAVEVDHDNQPGVLKLDDDHQRHPVFQAILTGDIAFYGFEISADDARGADGSNGNFGYFFVLQEHPAEPKFNFKGSANNASPSDYPDPSDPNAVAPTVAGQVGANAFETPTRVAIHGKDLLPPA
ncbi:MAG TPA: hypothetical protein VIF57_06195 [Polyangia bacterium]|jgi:hypothetical protein